MIKVAELKRMVNSLTADELQQVLELKFVTYENEYITDSIRFDFDSGRIIAVSEKSEHYLRNKANQEIEQYFLQKRRES